MAQIEFNRPFQEDDSTRYHTPHKPDAYILAWIDRNIVYNPETGDLCGPRGNIYSNVHSSGYIFIEIDRKQVAAHHIAWYKHHKVWPTKQLDHGDRNRAYNAITNLAEVTQHVQSVNRAHVINRKLPIGVYPQRTGGKFVAKITLGGKIKYLGSFTTPELASDAYQEAARGANRI